MKKKKSKKVTDSMFPVFYNGKKWYEDDCDDMFLAFYHCEEALNGDGGVYVGDDMSVYPDGSMDSY